MIVTVEFQIKKSELLSRDEKIRIQKKMQKKETEAKEREKII